MPITVTRAESIDIGSWPIGSDSNIIVAMDPVANTTSWAITFELSATRGSVAVLSLTSGAGEITTGGGTDGEEITINLTAANTASLSGRYWFLVRRTDSGQHDRLAFGTIYFDQPDV